MRGHLGAVRLDGWQDWGDVKILPEYGIRMEVEWAPALACIYLSAAGQDPGFPATRNGDFLSSVTYRYLDNTISGAPRWFSVAAYPWLTNKAEPVTDEVQFLDCTIRNHKGTFAIRLNKRPKGRKDFFALLPRGGRKSVVMTQLHRVAALTTHLWEQGQEILDLTESFLDCPDYLRAVTFLFFAQNLLPIPCTRSSWGGGYQYHKCGNGFCTMPADGYQRTRV